MSPPPPCFPLAALFDFVDDVLVWVKDRDGRYQWVNRLFLVNYVLDRTDRRTSGPSLEPEV